MSHRLLPQHHDETTDATTTATTATTDRHIADDASNTNADSHTDNTLFMLFFLKNQHRAGALRALAP